MSISTDRIDFSPMKDEPPVSTITCLSYQEDFSVVTNPDAGEVVVISSSQAHCTARCVLKRKIHSDSQLSLFASGTKKNEDCSSISPSIYFGRISPLSNFATSRPFALNLSLSALFRFNGC